MCNRYRLKAKPDELIDLFDLPRDLAVGPITAEYYPGKPVPVVLHASSGSRRLESMTWGFPGFGKSAKSINNTRSEGASASRFWSRHLHQRCAFPLSAAVEWQHRVDTSTGEVRKVPHTIAFRDERLGVVAGIYSTTDKGSCCSMMTCGANRTWAAIHNAKPDDPRMVCFLLDKPALAAWLDPSRSFDSVRDLLRPVPDESDLLIASPIGPPPDAGVKTLFG